MNSMTDVEVVQYVLRNKNDMYRILMVERTATESEVKVAYKKMALKCHPDKNKHPQAAEAFKLVGSAHTTLTDATKRRIYDRHGVEGVQRHESGGGQRRPANGAAAAGPYRRRPAGQRDFFEEFFFGTGNGMNGNAGPGGAHYQADVQINPNMLLLIPILFFVLMAMLLSSSYTDIDASQSVFGARGGAGGSGVAGKSFSFTPSPDDGFVVPRTTSLYGLRVQFYTTRRMSEMMDRRRDVYISVEKRVLEGQRDSLGRRCEAESFKFRSRGRKEDPPVCGEYQQFRRALG